MWVWVYAMKLAFASFSCFGSSDFKMIEHLLHLVIYFLPPPLHLIIAPRPPILLATVVLLSPELPPLPQHCPLPHQLCPPPPLRMQNRFLHSPSTPNRHPRLLVVTFLPREYHLRPLPVNPVSLNELTGTWRVIRTWDICVTCGVSH